MIRLLRLEATFAQNNTSDIQYTPRASSGFGSMKHIILVARRVYCIVVSVDVV